MYTVSQVNFSLKHNFDKCNWQSIMRHSTLDQENHINKKILKQTTHFQYINSVIIVINHLELFTSITKHNNNKKIYVQRN